MSASRYRLFAGVSPGFERLLAAELSRIAQRVSWKVEQGGAEGLVTRDELWAIAHKSRLAELMRVRLGHFPVTRFQDLVARLEKLPWSAYIQRGLPELPSVSAVAVKSKLIHTGAISERVLAALYNRDITLRPPRTTRGVYSDFETEAGGTLPAHRHSASSSGAPRIFVRMLHNECTVSVDAAGPQLHKRGYRLSSAQAPLRETIAAACLHAVHADLMSRSPSSPAPGAPPLLHEHRLWDPMCGSGTIVIEAAADALGLPATVERRMAFEDWPTHDAANYQTFLSTLRSHDIPLPLPPGQAVGSDIELDAIHAAVRNGERAKVADSVTFLQCEVLDERMAGVPQGTVLLTNLPYGKRLQNVQAARRRLEKLMEQRPDLRVYAIAPRGALARRTGVLRQEPTATGTLSSVDETHELGATSRDGATGTVSRRNLWTEVLGFENRGIPVALCRGR
jgi:putative N6-adenine-specific DNA methylase